jgi:hypothetical protein
MWYIKKSIHWPCVVVHAENRSGGSQFEVNQGIKLATPPQQKRWIVMFIFHPSYVGSISRREDSDPGP